MVPTQRSWSNYRLYSPANVAVVAQIMIYRATGMGLKSVSRVLAEEDDPLVHLRRQRALLMKKETALHQMVQAVNDLLERTVKNTPMDVEEIARILADASFAAYQDEAEEQWGGTGDWRISQETAPGMTTQDWHEVRVMTDTR